MLAVSDDQVRTHPMSEQIIRCPHSGLEVLSCKVRDICDCFEFPEAEKRAAEILDRRACALALSERRFDDMCDDCYDETVGDGG